MKPQSFKKLAIFTDIHFGRRSNSKGHNEDCLDFIRWFCARVKAGGDYSHVCFLGDWFESRSAINIETGEYSYQGLQMIDSLGLPVYFIVGNHDLARRTTREVHSVRMFNELKNFKVIDKVIVEDGLLFSPYLFEGEYANLIQYNHLWAFLGHFEFKNFVLTGYNTVLEHGPDHRLFPGPKRIFSGHFHKRQAQDNVIYSGNVFPMDYGDAGDYARGMCTYEVQTDKVTFTDWEDCPKYYKTSLSKVIDGKWTPLPKMKVKCVMDVELGYQEAVDLREAMIEAHNLRDFVIEEDRAAKQGLLEGERVEVTDSLLNFTGIDELVVAQLQAAGKDVIQGIDVNMLIDLYKDLPELEVTDNDE